MTEAVQRDRITEVRVEGFRSLESISLRLNGLTVLIGENGSGKTTLLEALELLRKAGTNGDFVSDQLLAYHDDFGRMLRQGAKRLRLGVTIEGSGPRIEYTFSVARRGGGGGLAIVEEQLDVFADPKKPAPLHAIRRTDAQCEVFNVEERKLSQINVEATRLAISAFGVLAQPAIARVMDALRGIEVYVPFDVRPSWVMSELGAELVTPRQPAMVEQSPRMVRSGGNLPNLLHELRQDSARWGSVLDQVRAGLGLDVEDLTTPAAKRRGQLELEVKFRGLPQGIPASALSAGQLTYLLLVVLVESSEARALVAIDEVEQHLHPALAARAVWLLERLARTTPVVIATHSDVILDAVSAPHESVVLCELDASRRTVLLRPDKQRLAVWSDRYRGLGEVRAQGYSHTVFTPIDSASAEHEAEEVRTK